MCSTDLEGWARGAGQSRKRATTGAEAPVSRSARAGRREVPRAGASEAHGSRGRSPPSSRISEAMRRRTVCDFGSLGRRRRTSPQSATGRSMATLPPPSRGAGALQTSALARQTTARRPDRASRPAAGSNGSRSRAGVATRSIRGSTRYGRLGLPTWFRHAPPCRRCPGGSVPVDMPGDGAPATCPPG
jgi:hypothetical protein